MHQPWDVLLVSAAALILISVARLHSFFPGVAALRPALLISVIALGALILNHRGIRRVSHLRSPLGYVMAFIFFWAAVGSPFALYPGHAVRTLLDEFLRTGVILVVIAAAIRNVGDVSRLLKVYALGAIAFSVLGGGGGFRAFGGGGYDANDAAMFVVSGLPLVVYFAVRAKRLFERLLFSLGAFACVSAVVLSGSRGGFIAFVAVGAFILLGFRGIRSWVRIAVVAGLMAVVTFTATGDFWDRMQSINDPDDYNWHSPGGRVEVWKRGVGYMASNPVLGVGINNFTVAEGRHPSIVADLEQGRGRKFSTAHSTWIQAGADLGIPGLVAMGLMFIVAVRMLWAMDRLAGGRRARGDPDLRMLGEMGRPLIGVLIAVAVAGSLLTSTYAGLLWAPFALTLGMDKLLRLKRRQRFKRPPGTWNSGLRPHPGSLGPVIQ